MGVYRAPNDLVDIMILRNMISGIPLIHGFRGPSGCEGSQMLVHGRGSGCSTKENSAVFWLAV